MRAVIFNFLRMEVLNTHPIVYWGLFAVWVGLCFAGFLSIRSQPYSSSTKFMWMGIILLLPILGLAAYAVYCLVTADWTFLKPLFQSRSEAVKSVVRPAKNR